MRLSRVFMLVSLALVIASPMAEANKYSPKSGSKFKLRPGKKATIKVTGFAGCKFEAVVDGSPPDAAVIDVKTPNKAGTSQKITVTAVAPGTTTLNLVTEGETPGCFGFFGTYEFTVEPDPKNILKQAKGKLKQGSKDLKSMLATELNSACLAFETAELFIGEGGNASEIVPELWGGMQAMANALDILVQEHMDEVYDDIWSRAEAEGFLETTPELLGLLDGGCGDWDKFVDSSLKEGDKAWKKMVKKYKALVKKWDKSFGKSGEKFISTTDRAQANVALTAPVPIPVPVPAPQPLPQAKELKKNWSSAGRLTSSSTSMLHVGGSADPGGGSVSVSVTGPGGTTGPVVGAVGKDCAWEVEFPTLTPGTYKVTMTQDGKSVTFTKYVP